MITHRYFRRTTLVAKLKRASVAHRHLTVQELPPECLHHFAWARNAGPLVTLIVSEIDGGNGEQKVVG
jgi:hypothetical protein